MEHGIIWKCKTSKFNFFAWPTVGKLQDGALAIVSSGFRRRHADPFGKVCIQYSKNEGKTWSYPAPIYDSPLDDRDAGLSVNGSVVAVTTFHNTIEAQRSFFTSRWTGYENQTSENKFSASYLDLITNEEVEKYVAPNYLISRDGGYTFDENYVAPENVSNPHGFTVLNDGRFFAIGRQYVNGGKNLSTKIVYTTSKDGVKWENGKTFSTGQATSDLLFCEPHAAQADNGAIIVVFRVDGLGNFTMYQSVSLDGGETFSVPKPMCVLGAPPHLIKHSSGALICAYGRRVTPYGQRAIVSFDHGKTWSHEITLRDDGFDSDLGYPSSVELSDGRILTAYYHNTEDFHEGRSLEYTIWSLEEVQERKKEQIFKMY